MTTAAAIERQATLLPVQQRRVLWAAVAGGFAVVACWAGLTPLYPEIASSLAVRADVLGAFVGLGAAISIACQIPVGVLVDRAGARPFLVAGLALMVIATVLRGVAPGGAVFAVALALMGLAIPFFAGGSITAVAAAYSASRRATPLGYIQTGTGLGQMAAFLAVGGLAAVLNWRQISLAMGVLPLLVLPLAATIPDPIVRETRSLTVAAVDSLRFLLRAGPASTALVAAAALAAGSAAVYVLPFALRGESLGAQAASLLLLPYLVGAAAGAPLAGWVVARAGYRATLGSLLGVGAAAALVVVAAGPRPAVLVPCYLLLGAASMSIPALAAGLAARYGERGGVPPGAALGGVRLAQATGPALGPSLGGIVYVHAGTSATLALTGALLVVAAALALGLRQTGAS